MTEPMAVAQPFPPKGAGNCEHFPCCDGAFGTARQSGVEIRTISEIIPIPVREFYERFLTDLDGFWLSLHSSLGGYSGLECPQWVWSSKHCCLTRRVTFHLTTKIPCGADETSVQQRQRCRFVEPHTVVFTTKTSTPDVPYGKTFATNSLFTVAPLEERSDSAQTHLSIDMWLTWIDRPWIGGMIERTALDGVFEYSRQWISFAKSVASSAQKVAMRRSESFSELPSSAARPLTPAPLPLSSRPSPLRNPRDPDHTISSTSSSATTVASSSSIPSSSSSTATSASQSSGVSTPPAATPPASSSSSSTASTTGTMLSTSASAPVLSNSQGSESLAQFLQKPPHSGADHPMTSSPSPNTPSLLPSDAVFGPSNHEATLDELLVDDPLYGKAFRLTSASRTTADAVWMSLLWHALLAFSLLFLFLAIPSQLYMTYLLEDCENSLESAANFQHATTSRVNFLQVLSSTLRDHESPQATIQHLHFLDRLLSLLPSAFSS